MTLYVKLRPKESYDPLSQEALDSRNASALSSGAPEQKSPLEEAVLRDNMSYSNTSLSRVQGELAEVRASLTEATCWRRTLYHETQVVEQEIKELDKQQRALLVREAELLGKVERIGRFMAPKESIPNVTKVQSLFNDLSASDKESLVASLLKEFTQHLPKEG